MADQRGFARLVIGFSSLVVAVCAVVVTVKITSTGVVSVQQPRVLDPKAVEEQVAAQVDGLQPALVACPVSVVVVPNTEFYCEYYGDHPGTASVTITDDQGNLTVKTNG
ncbi:MAG TPA: hypothetical protein VHF06_00940 [Pseudonocardiaceae bacterium]|jgi:hypothetical protein|nr:hypothetical protein [Pseudonocardiaceae bacterium]